MEEKSLVERLRELNHSCESDFLLGSFLSLCSNVYVESLGTVGFSEVLERLRQQKLEVCFIREENKEKRKYSLGIILRKTDLCYSSVFSYNEGSWEQLETDIGKEVSEMNKLGFKIDYRGFIQNGRE